jgi:hypothetical protein
VETSRGFLAACNGTRFRRNGIVANAVLPAGIDRCDDLETPNCLDI